MGKEDLKEVVIGPGSGIPRVLVRFRGRKVVEVRFVRGGRRREVEQAISSNERAMARRLTRDFSGYFAGKKVDFSGYKIRPEGGTEFQRKVWEALRRIPYGQTRTYKWLAGQVGMPNAARAVGNACGANPLPIIQPCHRVVASDGSLGGFSGGVSLKRNLLCLEGVSS